VSNAWGWADGPMHLPLFGGDGRSANAAEENPPVPRMALADLPKWTFRPHCFTAAGCQVGMGDGSVRSVRPGVSVGTWRAALTPANGEVADLD
jgi:hypothetical protein